MNKSLILVLLIGGLSISKAKAQTVTVDPALAAAIGAQAIADNSNHEKQRKLMNSIKTAQEGITLATTKITSWHQKFYKGLTEINSNISNAFQVIDAAKTIYSIGEYQVKMVQAAKDNPIALLFVGKIESKLVQRALKLEVILQQIILKAKDEKILLNAGERMNMMNDLLLELHVLEAFSASAYYKVQLVVRQGVIRSLNPFQSMYNDDKTLVTKMLQRVNF